MMLPQAKEHLESLEAPRGKERFSMDPSEGEWSCQCLDFRLLTPKTVREQVFIVLSPKTSL